MDEPTEQFRIGKLDAARRQIDSAIRLYFAQGDIVAIHTLAAAAYQLLEDLIAKRGGPKGFKDLFLELFKPEGKEEARRQLNAAQNFFKHADRDHDEVLDFRPAQTEFFLLDACERYYALTSEAVPTFSVYRAWFLVGGVGRHLAVPGEQQEIRRLGMSLYPNASREQFFQETLPFAAQLRTIGRK